MYNNFLNNLLKKIVCLLTRRAEEIIADRSSIDEAQHSQRAKWLFRKRQFIRKVG